MCNTGIYNYVYHEYQLFSYLNANKAVLRRKIIGVLTEPYYIYLKLNIINIKANLESSYNTKNIQNYFMLLVWIKQFFQLNIQI